MSRDERTLGRRGMTAAAMMRRMAAWWVLGAAPAGVVFVLLAVSVRQEILLAAYDHGIGRWWLEQSAVGRFDLLVQVTRLGDAWVVLPIVLASLARLWRAGRRLAAASLALTMAGQGLLQWGLKVLFARPRPELVGALGDAPGFSFPSGHALVGVVLYGYLAYLVGLRWSRPAPRLALGAAAGLVALAVGVSRLYLAVHYLTDVLAGWALGVVWLLLAARASRPHLLAEGSNPRQRPS